MSSLFLTFVLALPAAQLAPTGADAVPVSRAARETPESRVYRMAGPSVVSISVQAPVRNRFRSPRSAGSSELREIGSGTGVVIDETGLVVTNAHVVQHGTQFVLHFNPDLGGDSYTATLLNADAEWDLALLKIDDIRRFPAIPIGTSSDLVIGEKVIAIGTPFGISHSLTAGVLSGIHRDIPIEGRVYPGLIQTDAAINPGNSGGPLLNVRGELIGINNATNSRADGIGFAIPVDRVREILADRLLDADRSPRYWLGMRVEERDGCLFVNRIDATGPASAAGIEQGDCVAKVDGQPVTTLADYASALLPRNPGERIAIQIEGQSLPRRVQLMAPEARDTHGLMGFEVEPVTRRQSFFRTETHLRITEVIDDSPAAALGLKSGDIIWQVRVRDNRNREDWHQPSSRAELLYIFRSEHFVRDGDNFWVLREGSEVQSLQGHLDLIAES